MKEGKGARRYLLVIKNITKLSSQVSEWQGFECTRNVGTQGAAVLSVVVAELLVLKKEDIIFL